MFPQFVTIARIFLYSKFIICSDCPTPCVTRLIRCFLLIRAGVISSRNDSSFRGRLAWPCSSSIVMFHAGILAVSMSCDGSPKCPVRVLSSGHTYFFSGLIFECFIDNRIGGLEGVTMTRRIVPCTADISIPHLIGVWESHTTFTSLPVFVSSRERKNLMTRAPIVTGHA